MNGEFHPPLHTWDNNNWHNYWLFWRRGVCRNSCQPRTGSSSLQTEVLEVCHSQSGQVKESVGLIGVDNIQVGLVLRHPSHNFFSSFMCGTAFPSSIPFDWLSLLGPCYFCSFPPICTSFPSCIDSETAISSALLLYIRIYVVLEFTLAFDTPFHLMTNTLLYGCTYGK